MKSVETRAMALELKYCERCGGLWLRPKGSDLIFCTACSKSMAGLSPVWPRGTHGREQRRNEEGGEHEPAFWGEGGNA